MKHYATGLVIFVLAAIGFAQRADRPPRVNTATVVEVREISIRFEWNGTEFALKDITGVILEGAEVAGAEGSEWVLDREINQAILLERLNAGEVKAIERIKRATIEAYCAETGLACIFRRTR